MLVSEASKCPLNGKALPKAPVRVGVKKIEMKNTGLVKDSKNIRDNWVSGHLLQIPVGWQVLEGLLLQRLLHTTSLLKRKEELALTLLIINLPRVYTPPPLLS